MIISEINQKRKSSGPGVIDSGEVLAKLEIMTMMRLQKYLASAGVGSRRYCEGLIAAGHVSVNNERARLGMSVRPGLDRVSIRGREIRSVSKRVVIAVNKPAGVLCACRRDREEGLLITEIVNAGFRLFPAGRLDRDSEGLVILTNDGELAMRLTHPSFAKEKEYEVELDRPFGPDLCRRLEAGVELTDGLARAVLARQLSKRRIAIVLTEGRKRQVRRMLDRLGWGVIRLRRVRIADLELGNLRSGEWRQLNSAEVMTKLLKET